MDFLVLCEAVCRGLTLNSKKKLYRSHWLRQVSFEAWTSKSAVFWQWFVGFAGGHGQGAGGSGFDQGGGFGRGRGGEGGGFFREKTFEEKLLDRKNVEDVCAWNQYHETFPRILLILSVLRWLVARCLEIIFFWKQIKSEEKDVNFLSGWLWMQTSLITIIMLQQEDVDFTADLHGNWTLENAKSRLHQYLQMTRQTPDYKYSMVGPDHNR